MNFSQLDQSLVFFVVSYEVFGIVLVSCFGHKSWASVSSKLHLTTSTEQFDGRDAYGTNPPSRASLHRTHKLRAAIFSTCKELFSARSLPCDE